MTLPGAARLSGWVERTTARRMARAGQPLGRRQVFILPTRFGLLAALAGATMFLVALNYQNSLVFLLAFLLGAIGMAAMIACHRQLRGLRVGRLEALPVFAGETPVLRLTLGNPGRTARLGLALGTDDGAGRPVDIAAGAGADIVASLTPRRRGRHRLPPAELASSEPLGIFRSWSRIGPAPELIVYPRPAAAAPPPPGDGSEWRGGPRPLDDPEDFAGLARYRPGDRPGQLAWGAYARTGQLYRKGFDASRGGARWLNFASTPGTSAEERLAVLCRWLLDAARSETPWGLQLPGHRISPGRGAAHLHRCLRALALYPGPYDGC